MDESQSGGEEPHTAPNRAGARPVPGPLRAAARAVRTARGAREWPGWVLTAAGAALCVLGWYGVSGEDFVEQQVPYLASATVPGAALIVAGLVLVALRAPGRPPAPPHPPAPGNLTDRRIERLYALLVEPDGPEGPAGTGGPDGSDGPGPTGTGLLAVAEGTLYHRPGCPLVTGEHGAEPVDATAVRARGLTPCRICEPAAPGEPGAAGGPSGPGGPGDPSTTGDPRNPGDPGDPSEPAGPAHPVG
ncbi:hypothetical protein [Kitasatospora sp. NPDC059327]|uniref:hypothetical protein n=1 Tax=Kitasatospora sp. NPDC059327 TaxID=3346803 RepID=UPI0036BE3E6B